MTNTTCPQGHPLGSEPGCPEPLCFAMRVEQYEGDGSWLEQCFRAAIEPLQARVRELEQEPDLAATDWRECPTCHKQWPHPSVRSELICPDCRLTAKDAELARVREEKDGAYEERNRVVAALSKVFPAVRTRTDIEGWDPEWHGCVYIDLPTGQASWHFHDRDAWMFDHLPERHVEWDGHTTEEKYQRLASLNPEDSTKPTED